MLLADSLYTENSDHLKAHLPPPPDSTKPTALCVESSVCLQSYGPMGRPKIRIPLYSQSAIKSVFVLVLKRIRRQVTKLVGVMFPSRKQELSVSSAKET